MQAYVGEIRLVGFTYPPAGWMFCQGQSLNISEYNELYTLIGNTYGGDGITTFNLPDLRGRSPIHAGTLGGNNYVLGAMAGQEETTLTAQHVGLHTHSIGANNTVDSPTASNSPKDQVFGNSSVGQYESSANVATGPMLTPAGGGALPHENRQPFLAVNYIISLYGVFPSRG